MCQRIDSGVLSCITCVPCRQLDGCTRYMHASLILCCVSRGVAGCAGPCATHMVFRCQAVSYVTHGRRPVSSDPSGHPRRNCDIGVQHSDGPELVHPVHSNARYGILFQFRGRSDQPDVLWTRMDLCRRHVARESRTTVRRRNHLLLPLATSQTL